MYGLGFEEEYLTSPCSDVWTASDVVKLGFTMDDLIKYAHMEHIDQYMSLNPSAVDECNLGAKQKHITMLTPKKEAIVQPQVINIVLPPTQKQEPMIRITRKHRHGLK